MLLFLKCPMLAVLQPGHPVRPPQPVPIAGGTLSNPGKLSVRSSPQPVELL